MVKPQRQRGTNFSFCICHSYMRLSYIFNHIKRKYIVKTKKTNSFFLSFYSFYGKSIRRNNSNRENIFLLHTIKSKRTPKESENKKMSEAWQSTDGQQVNRGYSSGNPTFGSRNFNNSNFTRGPRRDNNTMNGGGGYQGTNFSFFLLLFFK